jgi:hypothetical protein
VTPSAACIERLSGSLADSFALERLGPPGRTTFRGDEPSLGVTVSAAHARHALRCIHR